MEESSAATLPETELLQADTLAGFNLVMISYTAWGDSDEEHQLLLAQSASVLIVKAPHS